MWFLCEFENSKVMEIYIKLFYMKKQIKWCMTLPENVFWTWWKWCFKISCFCKTDKFLHESNDDDVWNGIIIKFMKKTMFKNVWNFHV